MPILRKAQAYLSGVVRAGLIVIIAASLVAILWWVPKYQVASLSAKHVKPEDVFKAENDARATLAQILGGFVVLVGLYFGWKNITDTAANLELTKEGQITERFTKAIEQLGNSKLEIRLGGIYALERIARDSQRDHWPIMEVLTAYVRENAPAPRHGEGKQLTSPANETKPLATDIRAILTVIRRRNTIYEQPHQRLDLWGADLTGANLSGADLTGANLSGTNLSSANLNGANLRGAFLIGTNLCDTYLSNANLRGAFLSSADLNGAHLRDANLDGAHLGGTHLSGADLSGAHLGGAYLGGADLGGTNLRDVRDLSQNHIDSAAGDETTKLPSGIQMPLRWKKHSSAPTSGQNN